MQDAYLSQGLGRLLEVALEVVSGDRKAVAKLMDMTGDDTLPAMIRELAECLGRLVVTMEAKEYRVEMILEDLLHKQAALEDALHDNLTGLPNRAIFHEHLNKCLESAKREKYLLAVVFIDLDKFKPVNDELGHEAGDELLKKVAQRIEQSIRSADVAARLGGDEFALILDRPASKEKAYMICARVLGELNRPFALNARDVEISGCLGIAFYPGDGETPTALLKSADMAMYRAKSEGRCSIRSYNPDDDAALRSKQILA
jgi:diguanylate cyclase (GGDEF)-like protein